MTFAELHAQHPTPFQFRRYGSDIVDDKGNEVTLGVVVAMMNAAAKQIANDHLQLCRGYSPECVAACIRAVEALRDSEDPASLDPVPQDKCLSAIADKAVDAAIALLPKEANDD